VHRPLYDWFIDQFVPQGEYRPHQYEFNRLNITYTVMSKRKMLQLVKEGLVAGWDDPRMPTVCGLRRRGYTARAIRSFIDKIGYTKVEGMIDLGLLEHTVREDLKENAPRVCAIFDPVKLVITNYPDGKKETIVAENIDGIPQIGTREMTFGKELWIERGDFQEEGSKDFYRLSPNGREVRLKNAYIISATGCDKDAEGRITTVYATYDADSKSGTEGGNRKTKATINWVECTTAIDAEARLYDRLFAVENPSADERDFRELLNPDSLRVTTCKVEAALATAQKQDHFQFLKQGYFVVDDDSTAEHLIFNRTASLKDNWKK
ncbi:MAG: glutamine--tRNA ligase, partial [Paludibacteraceae bacterium]|nr:glutamine--tRNA ligase [Paludibacteraceae bacterium]